MSEPQRDGEVPAQPGPVVRDRRRIDPETGQVRSSGSTHAASAWAAAAAEKPAAAQPGEPSQDGPADEPAGEPAAVDVDLTSAEVEGAGEPDELARLQAIADERLADLQRLQAEFVNYRRRVERDRDVAREQATAGVLEALLPVLDDIQLARQHGDLEGTPFAAIAEKLDSVLQRFGLSSYGEPGQPFDPAVHEALVHTEAELAEGTTGTTVVQILQLGYMVGDRVLRAARVAVADPQ